MVIVPARDISLTRGPVTVTGTTVSPGKAEARARIPFLLVLLLSPHSSSFPVKMTSPPSMHASGSFK